MKRVLATLTILAALTASAGTADAGTQYGACGLKAPGAAVINGTTITSSGVARCNRRWTAVAVLSVEQGGEWAAAYAQGNPAPPQISGPHKAKTDHAINFTWHLLDPYPYCAYNWRVLVIYQDTNGDQLDSGYSPETHATCRARRPQ